MNNIYIKHHADDDSLTHYGVKGMKWRKRKRLTGLHMGYNEEMTNQLRDYTNQENMTRDRFGTNGKVRASMAQVGLATRREAKRRQAEEERKRSPRYRISKGAKKASKTLKRFGNRTVKSSKKAWSKGRKLLGSLGR